MSLGCRDWLTAALIGVVSLVVFVTGYAAGVTGDPPVMQLLSMACSW